MSTTVRLEWMPDSPVEYPSEGVYVTAAEVRDVLTSSHIHCTWEVRRDGELQPCGKEAVAIRFDENNGGLGEVCKHHAKRMLVPLSFIAEVASTEPDPWCREESCQHRNWQSGSMPTHKRGSQCPTPASIHKQEAS